MFLQRLVYSTLALSMAIGVQLPGRCDTTSTTIETTTVTAAPPIYNLPLTGAYMVVDPITGIVKGNLDLTTRLVNGEPLCTGLVIVDKNSGKLIASVDALGHIADINVAPAGDMFITSIETRRKDVEVSIDQALRNGQITGAQAQALRAALDRVAQEELAARVNGIIPYEKALVIGYELNAVADKLVFPQTHVIAVAPVISPKLTVMGGQVVLVDTFTSHRLRLSQRIDDEYTAGRLSAQQVSTLKQNLNDIAVQEAKYRKNGELSESKDRLLETKLDKLQSTLEKDVALINEKRSRIGIRVD